MKNEEAKALLEKHKLGQTTLEEIEKLLYWIQNLEESKDQVSIAELEAVKQEMWDKLNVHTASPKTVKLWPRIAAAASVILCLSAGSYLAVKRAFFSADKQIYAIIPGTGRAVLKMGNGKSVFLDGANSGALASNAGVTISKVSAGNVEYAAQSSSSAVSTDTIEIPRGGNIYHLKLSDGSMVILNAATKISFPESFSKPERKVELISGEAYFEVTHLPNTPFKVITHGQTIEDLGTHFNISAYADEPNVVTTLIEGSVRVSHGSQSVILKPGQQSESGKSYAIDVKNADTDEATAWKDGLFVFNNERLEDIMKQVSRWYNVDYSFSDNTLKNKLYSGALSRFGDVSKVLSKLALTGSVHFKIKERRIDVVK